MSPALATTVRGSGPDLVVHPGGPGMAPAYVDTLLDLADRYRVTILHPRGTGGTARPANPDAYSPDEYADDLIAWLTGRAEPPVLLGHSHGGVVVARAAARRPDLVRALVLLATPAYGGERAEAEAEAVHTTRAGEPDCARALTALAAQGDVYPDEADLGRHIAEVAPLWLGPLTDETRSWCDRIAAQPANLDALRYFNDHVFPKLDTVAADVAAASVPALAVAGDLDAWAGPTHLTELGVPSAVLPGAGHMCHVEAVPAIGAALDEFLDAIGERAEQV